MTAPSLRSLGTAQAGPTSTPSFAEPAGAISTDIIEIKFFVDGLATVTAAPTGFVAAPSAPQTVDAVSGDHSLQVYWARRSDAGAGPYGFTISASTHIEGRAAAIQDCITTGNPYEASNGAIDTGTVSTAPSVSATSTGVDRYASYAATNWSGGAWTPATGFVEQWDANNQIITYDDKSLPTAQTVTPQAVCAGTDRMTAWVGILIGTTVSGGATAGPWTGPTPGRIGPTGQWRGSLGDATTPLNVYVPDVPTGTGTAFDATVAVSPASDQTSGTGTAFDATADVQVNADTSAATGAAFDATVSVDFANTAGPWTGPTPGRLGPTGQWSIVRGDATSSPDLFISVPAEAAATGTAFDATVAVTVAADQTAGTGAAYDAAAALGVAAGQAAGSGTAFDTTADVQVNADTTTATASALDATVTATTEMFAGPWTGFTPGRISPTGRLWALLGDATAAVAIFNATSTDLVTASVTSTATAGSPVSSTAAVGAPATSTSSVSDG